MTGNVRDNCYPHICLLPTHPQLASTDFIRLLPVATSAHPLITHSQLPVGYRANMEYTQMGYGCKQFWKQLRDGASAVFLSRLFRCGIIRGKNEFL